MSKKVIIERNCVRTRHTLFTFIFILDFYLPCEMMKLAKSQNYQSHRKAYSSGRKGIAGQKKKLVVLVLTFINYQL